MSWRYWIAVSEYETRTWLIPGKSAAFAAIWFRFRCAGDLSAYVLSRVMTDPSPLICRSNLERTQSRQYWVLVSEFEIRLAHLWQSRIYCWRLLMVQLHWRVLGTYRRHSIIANPIPQSTQLTRLLSSGVRICDKGSLKCGNSAACAGISQSFRYIWDRHPRRRSLRHGSGIHGEPAPFAAGYVLACDLANDWNSGTTEICNPVQNDVLGFQWYQLWQAATHCECRIPGQERLNCDNTHPKHMFPTSYWTFYFSFSSFSSCFLRLWISGCCAHKFSSLKTLHV
jgi:hypothetical protein